MLHDFGYRNKNVKSGLLADSIVVAAIQLSPKGDKRQLGNISPGYLWRNVPDEFGQVLGHDSAKTFEVGTSFGIEKAAGFHALERTHLSTFAVKPLLGNAKHQAIV